MRFHFGRNEISCVFTYMRCVFTYMKSHGCLHTWDSISGEMKYFHQSLVAVYMIYPELKLVAGVISLRSFWQKRNFISGDKIHPKWNHIKGNICACVSKNDWLLLTGPFISDHPRHEIHFISPAVKSNVKQNSFHGGLKFHFGSHVSTL